MHFGNMQMSFREENKAMGKVRDKGVKVKEMREQFL